MKNQFCPKCGQQNPEEAKFCTGCGNRFDAGPVTPEATGTQSVPPSPPPLVAGPPAAPSPNSSTTPHYAMVMEMDYPKVGFGRRLLACLVDGAIGGLPLLLALALYSIDGLEVFAGILVLITGCWAFFYGFCKDGFSGGHGYGKKMNGLMVVSLSTNQPCTMGKSALRALPWYIPYVGGLIELVMVLVTDKGRRLGDKFAGTQVIDVNQYKG
ncbi:MAG TPA: RDD family protein [Patescibacteria group bacterium]|nr:RDD family protein [Patescibacteria group bacterium]